MSAITRCFVVLLTCALGIGALAAAGDAHPAARSTADGSPKVTALLVHQSGPALSVWGSDRRRHLEYDLLITNAFPEPVDLTSIQVLGPGHKVLLNLHGSTLAAATKPLIGGKPSATIAASGVVDTVIDVVLRRGPVPRTLTHRITYKLPPHPIGPIIQSEVIDGPVVKVDARRPLVIAPPLSGTGWYDGNGCCLPSADHRVGRLPVDGSVLKYPETFAIDWVKEEGGRFFKGNGRALRDHYAFGAVVRSATGWGCHLRA